MVLQEIAIEKVLGRRFEVTVVPNGDPEVYTIVPQNEANPKKGLLGVDSPLARALSTATSGSSVRLTIGREPNERVIEYQVTAVFD